MIGNLLALAFAFVLLDPGAAAGDPDPLGAIADWTGVSEFIDIGYGGSVSTAGDVNGDGYSDVIVSSVGFSSNRGKAYVHLGSASGLATTAHWTDTGAAPDDRFGFSVSTLGDVNNDGYDEIVVEKLR